MGYDIVVSGHLCADLLPDTSSLPLAALSSPGKLFEVDSLEISTGGAVSNTGLALHRLGVNVGLMTAVGDDLLGRVIIAKLKDRDPQLGEMIGVHEDVASSYSILLSPEGADRIILHCTGNNVHFDSNDINYDIVKDAKIFHLGYPPILPRLFADDGKESVQIFRRVHTLGVITSLDMALPDPASESGKVDWTQFLKATLPYVDIFLPSIEEIMFMLRRADYDQWAGNVLLNVSQSYLRDLAGELLEMGSTIVGFKLGDRGFYLHTSADAKRYNRFDRINLDVDIWQTHELWHPAYEVDVVGTTGAGDAAYGGFLAALLNKSDPKSTIQITCAVGACNTESHDATSGILPWDETLARIHSGWQLSDVTLLGD